MLRPVKAGRTQSLQRPLKQQLQLLGMRQVCNPDSLWACELYLEASVGAEGPMIWLRVASWLMHCQVHRTCAILAASLACCLPCTGMAFV